jgi:hypothetical protein
MSMHTPLKPAIRAGFEGERIMRSAGFELLARCGFAARALIDGIIGVLPIELAAGAGGKTTDQRTALETLARQPLGEVLLVLVAIGMAGYSLWRLAHASRTKEKSRETRLRLPVLSALREGEGLRPPVPLAEGDRLSGRPARAPME